MRALIVPAEKLPRDQLPRGEPVPAAALPGQMFVLGVFAATLLSLAVRPGERAHDLPRAQAEAVGAALESEAAQALSILAPIAGRLKASEPVDWKEFARLADPSYPTGPTASAGASPTARLYAWAPRVPASGRAAYERRTGDDGYRSFRVVERSGTDGIVPASGRVSHLPVHLAAPVEQTAALLGLDLAADAELAAAVGRARRNREPEVLGPRRLAQLPGDACLQAPRRLLCEPALLIVLPVFLPQRGPRASELGILLAALPWRTIEQTASARLRQSTGLSSLPTGVEQAQLSPSRRQPAASLLLPSAARAAFHVGDRLWTVDLPLSRLAGRARAQRSP